MVADDVDNDGISVGFIGCGTIASSIAKGLILAATSADTNTNTNTININSIVVSRRSESKSKELLDAYGGSSFGRISVTEDNQEILDRCDLIFLTVLPKQASVVLQSLKFDPDRHILVSLVSTANIQDLVEDSKLDSSRVSKMICLPSIARHQGVALLCCGDDKNNDSDSDNSGINTKSFLTNLFNAMGGVVALDSERDLQACMVTTCTMGPLYGTMKNQRDWLLQKTASLSKADATFLVIKQFAGAISDAEATATAAKTTKKKNSSDNDEDEEEDDDALLLLANRLETLIEEQTPGGLNEQALRNYGTVLGGFEDIQEPVMDAVLSRIRGETDGSIS